jgi:hypothetical protein
LEDWELLNKVVSLPIDEAIKVKTSDGRNFVREYMEIRRNYEYEYWSVESLEEI